MLRITGQRSEVRTLSPMAPLRTLTLEQTTMSSHLDFPRPGYMPRKSGVPAPRSPRVVLKGILDALAMVDIPVNDEDPGDREHRAHKGSGPPPPCQSLVQDARGWVGSQALPSGPTPCSRPSTHLCSPCFSWACLAAKATLLNTQNPLAAALWLWCPGGLQVRAGHGAWQGHPVPTWGAAMVGGQLSPHQGKPIVHSSCQYCIHQLQPGPCSQPGTVEGTLWGEG